MLNPKKVWPKSPPISTMALPLLLFVVLVSWVHQLYVPYFPDLLPTHGIIPGSVGFIFNSIYMHLYAGLTNQGTGHPHSHPTTHTMGSVFSFISSLTLLIFIPLKLHKNQAFSLAERYVLTSQNTVFFCYHSQHSTHGWWFRECTYFMVSLSFGFVVFCLDLYLCFFFCFPGLNCIHQQLSQ